MDCGIQGTKRWEGGFVEKSEEGQRGNEQREWEVRKEMGRKTDGRRRVVGGEERWRGREREIKRRVAADRPHEKLHGV